VEFAKKLILWSSVGVGVSVTCLAWRPIVGDLSWTAAIQRGELVLVAVTVTASAVGYAAMASVKGALDLLKVVVIALGTVELVLSIGVYAGFSQPSSGSLHSAYSVALDSYILLAASVLIGAASTYLTHRAE
jgi:hypothetical protein